mmetsp:Transcript_29827/g.44013  ORF Transcript_29827/g.44013 Transcript_29827/m.44013 type:complete len:464 (-) Transcript_29827:6-1397(-)
MLTGLLQMSTTELTDRLYQYTRLNVSQLLLLTILSAIAVYRREMSCNHVYYVDDDEDEDAAAPANGNAATPDRNDATTTRRSNDGRQQEKPKSKTWKDSSNESLLFLFTVVWNFLRLTESCGKQVSKEKRMSATWDDCADDILDGAGSFLCSPTRLMWDMVLRGKGVLSDHWSPSKKSDGHNRLTDGLAPDVQVHVLSFLHPRDVVTFACASKTTRMIVDHGQTSLDLWGSLWKRDYAWLVEFWALGRTAFLQRSAVVGMEPTTTKEFYFRFGLSYTNYVLAGHNTPQSCFVAIHGSIYDLTSFLDKHPGSPDTILVHAGKDATENFDDMGHSASARKYARTLCVAVDNFSHRTGDDFRCGVQPTNNTNFAGDARPSRTRTTVTETASIPFNRRRHRPTTPSTLNGVRQWFLKEQEVHQKTAERTHANNSKVLSHVNVFYDPFTRQWQLWYTDTDFKTVFERL